jgi:hypothetical protein
VVVVVVVVVAVLAGVGIFCEAPASRITNAARKFVIVLRIPSGKGPDRVSFQSSSICRSLASHCATMLSDIAGSCGCVRICCVFSCCSCEECSKRGSMGPIDSVFSVLDSRF